MACCSLRAVFERRAVPPSAVLGAHEPDDDWSRRHHLRGDRGEQRRRVGGAHRDGRHAAGDAGLHHRDRQRHLRPPPAGPAGRAVPHAPRAGGAVPLAPPRAPRPAPPRAQALPRRAEQRPEGRRGAAAADAADAARRGDARHALPAAQALLALPHVRRAAAQGHVLRHVPRHLRRRPDGLRDGGDRDRPALPREGHRPLQAHLELRLPPTVRQCRGAARAPHLHLGPVGRRAARLAPQVRQRGGAHDAQHAAVRDRLPLQRAAVGDALGSRRRRVPPHHARRLPRALRPVPSGHRAHARQLPRPRRPRRPGRGGLPAQHGDAAGQGGDLRAPLLRRRRRRRGVRPADGRHRPHAAGEPQLGRLRPPHSDARRRLRGAVPRRQAAVRARRRRQPRRPLRQPAPRRRPARGACGGGEVPLLGGRGARLGRGAHQRRAVRAGAPRPRLADRPADRVPRGHQRAGLRRADVPPPRLVRGLAARGGEPARPQGGHQREGPLAGHAAEGRGEGGLRAGGQADPRARRRPRLHDHRGEQRAVRAGAAGQRRVAAAAARVRRGRQRRRLRSAHVPAPRGKRGHPPDDHASHRGGRQGQLARPVAPHAAARRLPERACGVCEDTSRGRRPPAVDGDPLLSHAV
mmetsp:Transcript_18087/g.45339  ORF Transcript_18087/g.45339 Transcript_18087/m.45339 type:complete len:635 (+) Transcript_18087:865-2769(+)